MRGGSLRLLCHRGPRRRRRHFRRRRAQPRHPSRHRHPLQASTILKLSGQVPWVAIAFWSLRRLHELYMHADMYADMYVDMCADRNADISADMCRHVCRHVFRHVYRPDDARSAPGNSSTTCSMNDDDASAKSCDSSRSVKQKSQVCRWHDVATMRNTPEPRQRLRRAAGGLACWVGAAQDDEDMRELDGAVLG